MRIPVRAVALAALISILPLAAQGPAATPSDTEATPDADPDITPAAEPEARYVADAAALRADAGVQRAFAAIESGHDAALADLVALNQIPAPPFGEGPRGEAFAELLRATGFGEVTIDEVGNVIARREGTGARAVMVAAHLDTVFSAETDVTVRIEGDRYTAPGIGDNTRGLVMMLEMARAIAAADIRTEADILLIGNVGEEGLGDLRGVRHLFREGAPRPDSFIAIDGGDDNRLVYGGVGSNRYRVTFRGPGGHSWGAFGTGNTHHAAARAITAFVETAAPLAAEGPKSSYNVGRIGGGTSVNSIPFETWFEVDMRSGDPVQLAELDGAFQAAMQAGLAAENAALDRGDPLTVEIENIGQRPAGRGDATAPLVQRAVAAMRARDLAPELTISSTDANVPISLGIPAITISRCGESGRSHSLDEYWVDSETTVACTQTGLAILLAEAELAGE